MVSFFMLSSVPREVPSTCSGSVVYMVFAGTSG